MPLTPIEIKNKTFSKAFGGYNRNEVKAFLIVISKEIEELRNEKVTFAQKVDELTIRLNGFEKNEKLLKDTLVTAQKATADIKDNARKEAELIISKAKQDAENIKRETQEQIRKIQERISELDSQKINLVTQIKALISNVTMWLEREHNQKKTQ
jgi:cell division initiation protein